MVQGPDGTQTLVRVGLGKGEGKGVRSGAESEVGRERPLRSAGGSPLPPGCSSKRVQGGARTTASATRVRAEMRRAEARHATRRGGKRLAAARPEKGVGTQRQRSRPCGAVTAAGRAQRKTSRLRPGRAPRWRRPTRSGWRPQSEGPSSSPKTLTGRAGRGMLAPVGTRQWAGQQAAHAAAPAAPARATAATAATAAAGRQGSKEARQAGSPSSQVLGILRCAGGVRGRDTGSRLPLQERGACGQASRRRVGPCWELAVPASKRMQHRGLNAGAGDSN